MMRYTTHVEKADLIIVGGGPAGAAAAVYAARKRLKTILVTEEWGGQSTVSLDIQNWIGTPSISGANLAKALNSHVDSYAGEWLAIRSSVRAEHLVEDDGGLSIALSSGETIVGKTLLIASGAARRKLEVPGAAEYDQKGLTYCASCDGPLFDGQDVAVIGGGNAAFETAAQLMAYCKSVTIINRSDAFRADNITVEKVLGNPVVRALKNAIPVEVVGEQFVTGIKYRDVKTNEIQLLPVAGIFVEIGLIPNTAWAGAFVEKNEIGQITVDPRTGKTSHGAIWAAGDCTDALYHQNNIAAGDAVKALEDIYMHHCRS